MSFIKSALLVLLLLVPFSAYAVDLTPTLEEDITKQGKTSYLHKTLTAQQLGAMIRDYETLAATHTLTYADCGKTVFLSHATEFVTTLPLPSAGCYFKFIVANIAESNNYTVVTNASANIIAGHIHEAEVDDNVDGSTDQDGDTITFLQATTLLGDWASIVSDGTLWYLTGASFTAAAVTLTKAS